jgi:hypothetical protein
VQTISRLWSERSGSRLGVQWLVDALATDQETYDAVMSVSTGDEKLAAAQRLARQAVAARTAPPAINVLDMPMHTLQALAAVWVIVSHWTPSLDPDRSLQSLLMVCTPDEAETAMRLLIGAGLLPPEGIDDEARPRS